ncbi:hypothetical protein BU204_13055 [Actinophytocola xanthii]|uniref:Uncharacterized protein n=1 Tax=Actinophytocola xanthii TaxID=1912961 RepID=A0A1Q8CRR6_9PSEU|nr:hypothetical protein BU204_13055 [Actinophytocola xanthii]
MDRVTAVDRLNVALTAQASEALKKLLKRTGFKKVDIANRALVLYEFIEAELRAGNALVIRDPNGGEQGVKIL